MTGSGRTIAQGSLSIGGSVGLDAGRVLENRGTATWSAGSIDLNAGSGGGSGRIENAAGALFEASGDNTLSATGFSDRNTVAGFPAFNNAGTLRKAGGAGITAIDVALNNTGTVQVASGTLSLRDGGVSSGSIGGAAASTLRFNGGMAEPGLLLGLRPGRGNAPGHVGDFLGQGFQEPAAGERGRNHSFFHAQVLHPIGHPGNGPSHTPPD